MQELKRLVAICILTASLFSVVLAEGGDLQTPPLALPAPPAECTTNCSNSAVTSPAPTSEVTTDLANNIVTWLVKAIL